MRQIGGKHLAEREGEGPAHRHTRFIKDLGWQLVPWFIHSVPDFCTSSQLRRNCLSLAYDCTGGPGSGRHVGLGYLTEKALRDHKVYEQADDRIRSAVRARQALLREQKGWDIGLYPPTAETQREIGSYLANADPDANFIAPEVAQLVRREVACLFLFRRSSTWQRNTQSKDRVGSHCDSDQLTGGAASRS